MVGKLFGESEVGAMSPSTRVTFSAELVCITDRSIEKKVPQWPPGVRRAPLACVIAPKLVCMIYPVHVVVVHVNKLGNGEIFYC